MRKELKDFLNSEEMIFYLPRDYSKDVISQWKSCRNILHPPLNWLIINISKFSPYSKWTSAVYRVLLGIKVGKLVGFAQIEPDILLPEAIEIDDFATFGWKVIIHTHEFTQHHQRFGKVKIGKNALIGAHSIIRSGVKVGNNSIIAPHSFVVTNVPANELWGGNPAKLIKEVDTHHLSPEWNSYKKGQIKPMSKHKVTVEKNLHTKV